MNSLAFNQLFSSTPLRVTSLAMCKRGVNEFASFRFITDTYVCCCINNGFLQFSIYFHVDQQIRGSTLHS